MVTMNTKRKRIKKLKESINKEWSQYYFKFIKYLYWSWISMNQNITWEIVRDICKSK